MKQLTYKATVEGETLVIRFTGSAFETIDPTEVLLDDPPRSVGAAGAHAWYAVVLAWSRREDRHVGWHREVVHEIVGDARARFREGAARLHRYPVHVFQDAATRRAEEHYAPPQAAREPTRGAIPPALRGAVLRPLPPRRDLGR